MTKEEEEDSVTPAVNENEDMKDTITPQSSATGPSILFDPSTGERVAKQMDFDSCSECPGFVMVTEAWEFEEGQFAHDLVCNVCNKYSKECFDQDKCFWVCPKTRTGSCKEGVCNEHNSMTSRKRARKAKKKMNI